MKNILFLLCFLMPGLLSAQIQKSISLNKEYNNVKIESSDDIVCSLHFKKEGVYQVNVLQQGVDVVLILSDQNNKEILRKDTPNGLNGLETFEFKAAESGLFYLKIERLEEAGNPPAGVVSINIKQVSKDILALREKIRKELEPENQKIVQTLDIDHFWEAYDQLKNCKNHSDSVATIQKLYLNRGTNGLKDFIISREFTAEKFVAVLQRYPKFYASVRPNTLLVKNAVPVVNEIVAKFSTIYPGFKPKKVCFAIGITNTGGAVSDSFLLIGSEVSTATKSTNISEFNGNAYSKSLSNGDDVVQKIKNIVSHEYVHTQQNWKPDTNAIKCPLLFQAINEGSADFIGELLVGGQINPTQHQYGNNHEKELWLAFKNELCNSHLSNWFYNSGSVKDKPQDLGYYIGYKIVEAYYQNTTDKLQAITDILNVDDPIKLLQMSKYDQKEK